MSADVCKSKIPIWSPSPLRRSLSMRMKGERSSGAFGVLQRPPGNEPSADTNRPRKRAEHPLPLRRGNSFAERGVGAKGGNNVTGPCSTAAAYRPTNRATTEARSQGAPAKGAPATPTSPGTRTRSLVSAFRYFFAISVRR